jgi:hypothetical protein
MKYRRLGLITALTISGAFAGESTISGDAKVFYGTDDIQDHDMFDKGASYGDASVNIDYTKDISENITLNAGVTGISTLGLENTAVSAVWVGAGKTGVEDTAWIDVANITAKFGNTTAVIGRQKLDTPLAFTETWNVVENTFDAFTFVNANIPKTKIIASAVTRANGMGNFTNVQGGMMDLGDGIYAAGLVTELIPLTTFQAWYYEGNGVVNAKKTWVQADAEVIDGVTVGAQYASDDEDAVFIAGKVGYDKDNISAYVAFSQADDQGTVNFTNFGGFGASKAYTEAWWNFGYVTNPDATTVAGGASYDLGSVKLGAQYTSVDSGMANNDMDELTLTADTSVGGIDATLAFINTTADDDSFDGNTVQVYMTVPFKL